MKFTIDQVIDFIRTIAMSAAPEAIIAVLRPFLPAWAGVLLDWATEHKDCLDELLAALRGQFTGDSKTALPVDAIAECRSECVDG